MVRAGQRLYKERVRRKLNLEEVADAIKIKADFLAAIERGEYRSLPSPAYAEGFVKNYADYLGLSKTDILPLFRREFDEKKAYKVLPDSFTKTEGFPINRVHLQQSVVVVVGILLVLLGYLFLQYRSAFLPPSIAISSPKPGSTTTKELVVKGKTDKDATVFINDEATSVNGHGEFVKNLTLFPGKATIIVKAKNRFGKETVVTREIVVK